MNRFSISLPSLDALFQSARASLQRFPWVLTAGLASFSLASYLVGSTTNDADIWRILLAVLLGFPLFFALSVWAEQENRSRFFPLIGILFLVGYYATFETDRSSLYLYRFWQLNLVAHLLVAVLPFWGSSSARGFWQYNRTLLQRFLVACVYSGVFYGGLAVALSACSSLFEFKLPKNIFAYLWFFTAFVLHPWFFVSGIPKKLSDLDGVNDYPTPLRVLIQYLLIPLLTLYGIILYAYTFKIIGTQAWPKGMVAWMVCGVSIFGILTLLLAYPLREKREYRWVNTFSRWFYVALFPLILLLVMAVWRRVSEYGITENRYFLIVLSFWISGIATWFTWRPTASIKLIPLSLAIVALVTSTGPWSAYSVSRHNQRSRLRQTLERLGLFADGKIQKASNQLLLADRKAISASVDYLVGRHGLKTLQPWFTEPLRSSSTQKTTNFFEFRSDERNAVLEKMGVPYTGSWISDTNESYPFNFHRYRRHTSLATALGPYTHLIYFESFNDKAPFIINDQRYALSLSSGTVSVNKVGKANIPVVSTDLKPLIEKLRTLATSDGLSVSSMTVTTRSSSVQAEWRFQYLSGYHKADGTIDVNSAGGELLLGFKNE